MTMHLEGPALTTTSYKKRKERITKTQQEELERGWRERNKRLKEMGLAKETLEQYTDWVYGRGKKAKTTRQGDKSSASNPGQLSRVQCGSRSQVTIKEGTSHATSTTGSQDKGLFTSSSPKAWITGPVSSKPAPTYTGSKIIGIGTMHKSNMVPIFSDDEAKDISRMRR